MLHVETVRQPPEETRRIGIAALGDSRIAPPFGGNTRTRIRHCHRGSHLD